MSHRALSPDQFHFIKADPRAMGGAIHHTVYYGEPDPAAEGGMLRWHAKTGEIHNIEVSPGMRRQGIATAMYGKAKEISSLTRGVKTPRHSPDRSEAGEAWARSLGERLPKRLS